jgi:hypothetical protein
MWNDLDLQSAINNRLLQIVLNIYIYIYTCIAGKRTTGKHYIVKFLGNAMC